MSSANILDPLRILFASVNYKFATRIMSLLDPILAAAVDTLASANKAPQNALADTSKSE